jgi:hypothetical protein
MKSSNLRKARLHKSIGELTEKGEENSTAPPKVPYPSKNPPRPVLLGLGDFAQAPAWDGSPTEKVDPKKSSSSLDTQGKSHRSRDSNDFKAEPGSPHSTLGDGFGQHRGDLPRPNEGLAEGLRDEYAPSLSISDNYSGEGSSHAPSQTSSQTSRPPTAPDDGVNADLGTGLAPPHYFPRRGRQGAHDIEDAISRRLLEERAQNKSLYWRYRAKSRTEQIVIALSAVVAAGALVTFGLLIAHAKQKVDMRKWYTSGVLVIFLCIGVGMWAGGQNMVTISMVMTMELVLGFFLTGNLDVFMGMTA